MEGKKKFKPDPDLKLLEQVREVLRYHHYAYRTEQTYEPFPCGHYLLRKLSFRLPFRFASLLSQAPASLRVAPRAIGLSVS